MKSQDWNSKLVKVWLVMFIKWRRKWKIFSYTCGGSWEWNGRWEWGGRWRKTSLLLHLTPYGRKLVAIKGGVLALIYYLMKTKKERKLWA